MIGNILGGILFAYVVMAILAVLFGPVRPGKGHDGNFPLGGGEG